MKSAYLILGLLLFLSLKGFSQDKGYSKGYVVTESGETINGFLKDLSDVKSCTSIKFKNLDGEKVKFKVKGISAYKRGEDFYIKKLTERSASLGKKEGLMKVIERGEVSLFLFCYTGSANISSSGHVSGGGAVRDYYLEKNGKHILIKKNGFKKKMKEYFRTNEEIVSKIESKDLKYRDLPEIVNIYNKGRAKKG